MIKHPDNYSKPLAIAEHELDLAAEQQVIPTTKFVYWSVMFLGYCLRDIAAAIREYRRA